MTYRILAMLAILKECGRVRTPTAKRPCGQAARRLVLGIVRFSLGIVCLAPAAATAEPPASQPATQPADAAIPIAILDFESTTPGNPDLGKEISDVLNVSLSGEAGIKIVDRAAMTRTLQEHELNHSGLVNPAEAIKIGNLVGARIIVTGKAFSIEDQVYITVKMIGTETSLLDGVIVKGAKGANMADLIMDLTRQLPQRLRTRGPGLLPAGNALIDPLPALKASLAGRKLPKVCVNIPEHHLNPVAVVHIDPAAETEVKNVLISAGFTVIDASTENEMDKAGVEVAISGEAFSEFNARIGNLISCSGRVEMQAVQRKNSQLLFSDRTTTRAVDLADNIAGKTALQKAGRDLAIKLLQHFAETLPPPLPATPGQK